jgi:ketosteroid isomerase-like protein
MIGLTTSTSSMAMSETHLKEPTPDMAAPSFPLQPSFASSFAQEWIEAWNSHDLERILSHYADEVLLISPVALKLLGDSAVRGKSALRGYFSLGLQAIPNLRFDLVDVLWGAETVVLVYRNNVRGTKTAEVLLIDPEGKVIHVWANYDQ